MSRLSDEEFQLDTSNFDAVIQRAKSLAEKMRGLRHELDVMQNTLMQSWGGEGGNMFAKKYRLYAQQFSDLKDELFEISESLLAIEEQYIQWDTDCAKAIDGQSICNYTETGNPTGGGGGSRDRT